MSADGEKTEEPTEHKLQEARKKGQIFKSQEIVQALVLLATMGAFAASGKYMLATLNDFIKSTYGSIATLDMMSRNVSADMFNLIWVVLKVLAPLFAVGFIVAIIANVVQIKFIFSTHPLTPTLSKISPIEGFKRIFSAKSLMELIKQVLKLLIIGYVSYKVVRAQITDFRYGSILELSQSIAMLKSLCYKIVAYVLAAISGIAVVDYIFQRYQYMKQMRMSVQELKDEYKDTEGNPQVKAKMRQLMRQGAQGRMMEEVPNSTAVVTNPTHIAVALRYRQGEDPAPIVTAKGENIIAQQIKLLAEDHDIPMVENVELARALAKNSEVGQSIPADLYKAVAEVLAYVIRLQKKRMQMRRRRYQNNMRRAR